MKYTMKGLGTLTHIFIFISVFYALVSASKTNNCDFKIAAFNVQAFGTTKMKHKDVVHILIQIIQRYDVILIQEIRDASGEAIISLLEQVNGAGGHNYDMKISERLGRKSHKEQYAFLIRSDTGLEVVSTYQYPVRYDKFHRPPFAVLLKVPGRRLQRMALVAIHTSPSDTARELDALVDVHAAVKKEWNTDNIVIMGDFNAAPKYITRKQLARLRLRDTSKYHWLIPDSFDTTVGKSHSAYDRFVQTGRELSNSIVPGNTTVFRFNDYFHLDVRETKAVSDHFPIEFAISTN